VAARKIKSSMTRYVFASGETARLAETWEWSAIFIRHPPSAHTAVERGPITCNRDIFWFFRNCAVLVLFERHVRVASCRKWKRQYSKKTSPTRQMPRKVLVTMTVTLSA